MMKKFLKKKLGNEKGMTLIELLAVIVILAIIAAIAIPAIGNIIENSRHKAAVSDVQMVLSAANLYFTEEGLSDGDDVDFTTNVDATTGAVTVTGDLLDYVDDPGNVTDATVTKASSGNTITATVVTPQGTYDFTNTPSGGTAAGYTNQELSNLTTDDIDGLFTAN